MSGHVTWKLQSVGEEEDGTAMSLCGEELTWSSLVDVGTTTATAWGFSWPEGGNVRGEPDPSAGDRTHSQEAAGA